MLRKIFEGQIYQTFFAIIFIYLFMEIFYYDLIILKKLIVFSIISSLVHQLYVVNTWRIQLYTKYFTSKFKNAYLLYKIGFLILFNIRLILIILVSIYDRNSIQTNSNIIYMITSVISILVLYAIYSVIRYFGINRVFGLDHFDEEIRKTGLVKKGIFKYTHNGMYGYGALFFYIFPLIFFSKAGLYVAVFNHMHLWIHYFCTERIDMNEIYN